MSETTPPENHEDWKAWMHDRVTQLETWMHKAKYPWSKDEPTPTSQDSTNGS